MEELAIVAARGAAERAYGTRHGVVVTRDRYRLPVTSWVPEAASSATVIAVHAFGDYRQSFAEIGPALAARGFAVAAFDQRGFGETATNGRWPGWRRLVSDLRRVIDELRPRDGSPWYLLGESLGGGVALATAARFRPEGLGGLILVEPAVRNGVRWGTAWSLAFGTLALVAPGYSRELVRGVHPLLTATARRRLGSDPLIVRRIRADAYKGLISLADAASTGARRLRIPTLLLYGRADGIIPLKLFERATVDLAPVVTALRYPEAPHLLLQTVGWMEVVEDICAWLQGGEVPASAQAQLCRSGPPPAQAA